MITTFSRLKATQSFNVTPGASLQKMAEAWTKSTFALIYICIWLTWNIVNLTTLRLKYPPSITITITVQLQVLEILGQYETLGSTSPCYRKKQKETIVEELVLWSNGEKCFISRVGSSRYLLWSVDHTMKIKATAKCAYFLPLNTLHLEKRDTHLIRQFIQFALIREQMETIEASRNPSLSSFQNFLYLLSPET